MYSLAAGSLLTKTSLFGFCSGPSVACGSLLVQRPHCARIRITPLELHFERRYDIILIIPAVLMIAT